MNGGTFIGTLDPEFNPFDGEYVAEILEATARAWARMRPPKRDDIEDRITFRLAGRLANAPEFAEIPYDVTPQWWIVGLEGELLGRLDIRFKHRRSKRDYFGFEAKRLHVTYPSGRTSKEYSTYAGEAGMMAFIEGQYSKMLPAGGMLGYVMDGKTDEAWSGIGKQIESQRTVLQLSTGCTFGGSTLSKVLDQALNGSHLGETDHDLKTHHLRLFHLLLPVRIPAAWAP
jgi:hypothetical protein